MIRKAARQTAAYAAAHPLSESALVRQFCGSGRPVTAVAASRDDLAALTRAAQPVYAELERDPDTKALIAAIRELKTSTPADPVAAPPPDCSHEAPVTRGRVLDPSTLNGTYHWRVTSAGARAARRQASPLSEDIGTIGKMTLRDGKWRMGDEDPEALLGHVRDHRQPARLRLGRHDADVHVRAPRRWGLDLKPVPPMDLGDAVVWAGGPWRRVGPPVRDIP